MRILIVEDAPELADVLNDGLTEDGYSCDVASNASQAYELVHMFPYALVVLDAMLPEGINAGYELGRKLRSEGISLPILFLTARGDIEDRVEGLEAGGDDYLVKPFAFKELKARLRALIRRSGGQSQNSLMLPYNWLMDTSGKELSHDGVPVELTRREFALLELMAINPSQVFSREAIIDRLWSGECSIEHKVIDVYVSNIRRKTDERIIDTLRGTGYRLGRE